MWDLAPILTGSFPAFHARTVYPYEGFQKRNVSKNIYVKWLNSVTWSQTILYQATIKLGWFSASFLQFILTWCLLRCARTFNYSFFCRHSENVSGTTGKILSTTEAVTSEHYVLQGGGVLEKFSDSIYFFWDGRVVSEMP